MSIKLPDDQHDRPAKKFERALLDEATYRSLAELAVVLNLDPRELAEDDTLETWAEKSGGELMVTSEGGAVGKRPNGKFVFVSAEQLAEARKQLEWVKGK